MREREQAFLEAYEALCREHGLTFWVSADYDGEIEAVINDYDDNDLQPFRRAM